jgi:hypothetical protein
VSKSVAHLLVLSGRPQRREAVSVIALGVRPLDLRQTAKSAGGQRRLRPAPEPDAVDLTLPLRRSCASCPFTSTDVTNRHVS